MEFIPIMKKSIKSEIKSEKEEKEENIAQGKISWSQDHICRATLHSIKNVRNRFLMIIT